LGEKWLIDFGFTRFDFGFPAMRKWSWVLTLVWFC